MSKYVVYEIGYEYNDEYYYTPECGGGRGVKVCNTLAEALVEIEKRNEATLRELGIDEVAQYIAADDYSEYESYLNAIARDVFHSEEIPADEDITEEQWKELFSQIRGDLDFYSFWELSDAE